MNNNVNLNTELPIIYGSFNGTPIPQINRGLLLSPSKIIPNNKGDLTLTSADQWLRDGGSVNDNEYKFAKPYFIGRDDRKTMPKSLLVGKRITGNAATIISGEVAPGLIDRLKNTSIIPDPTAVLITFQFNGATQALTIDITTATNESILASLVQAALVAYIPTPPNGENKRKSSDPAPLLPNATVTWNVNSSRFSVVSDTAANTMQVNFCLNSPLAIEMALTETNDAELSNGSLGMTALENMRYLKNLGVLSYYTFQAAYDIQYTPEEYLGLCEFCKENGQRYGFVFPVYASNIEIVVPVLIENGYGELYTDVYGNTRFRWKIAASFVYIPDETDASGQPQVQNLITTSILFASSCASNDPQANQNAFFQNLNGASFSQAGLVPCVITDAQMEIIMKYHASAYISYKGNYATYSSSENGRMGGDFIWFDNWCNAIYTSTTLQDAYKQLEQAGNLTQEAADGTTAEYMATFQSQGFFGKGNFQNYQNNPSQLLLLQKISTVMGLSVETLANDFDENGWAYKVVPAELFDNTQLSNFVFLHLNGNAMDSEYVKGLVNKFTKEDKIVVFTNGVLSENTIKNIVNNKSFKYKFTNSNKQEQELNRAISIKFNSAKELNVVNEDYLTSYVPEYAREIGLISLVAVIGKIFANKITMFFNQVNQTL